MALRYTIDEPKWDVHDGGTRLAKTPPPNANSTITTWVGASLSYGDLLFVLVGANQVYVKAIVQAKHLEPNRVDRIVQRLVVP